MDDQNCPFGQMGRGIARLFNVRTITPRVPKEVVEHRALPLHTRHLLQHTVPRTTPHHVVSFGRELSQHEGAVQSSGEGGGSKRPRDRADTILAKHANWDGVALGLEVQMIRGTLRWLQYHECRRHVEIRLLQNLLASGVPCARPGCEGSCAFDELAFDTVSCSKSYDDQVEPMDCERPSCSGVDSGDAQTGQSVEDIPGAMSMQHVVLVVLPEFHLEVPLVTARCDTCGSAHRMQPHHLLCWPSTPVRPYVWYSRRLLQEGVHHQLTIASSVRQFCEVKYKVHIDMMPPGSAADFETCFRNFGTCLERYRVGVLRRMNPAHLGIRPISSGFCLCPACWRHCVAANADACLGLTRLWHAAKSSRSRAPVYGAEESLWVADSDIKALIELRRGITLPTTSCSEFKAAASLGRRSKIYEELGVAAATCRHEFVILLLNLFTEESLLYYEHMLQVLDRIFQPADKTLDYLVIDA